MMQVDGALAWHKLGRQNTVSKPATSARRADPLPIPTGTKKHLDTALAKLPFATHLSFEPLIETLDALGHTRHIPDALRGVVTDDAVLETHADTVQAMMSAVFPELMDTEIAVRAYAPFAPRSFFTTSKYREIFGAEGVEISQANGLVKRQYYRENMLFAYRIIHHTLQRHVDSPQAFVKQIRDTQTGLDRYYMNEGSIRFVRVSYPSSRLLDAPEFARLLAMEDLETLEARMPLHDAVYEGFIYIRYVDITELHNLSLLKSELVEPRALHRMETIEARLRSVLRLPDLDVGVVLRYAARGATQLCDNRSLLSDVNACMAELPNSLYERAIDTSEPQFELDLRQQNESSRMPTLFRERGYRSVGLIPLVERDPASDQNHVIAALELASPTPGAVHPAIMGKFRDVLSPLAVAARREMDSVTASMERAIKTHCTAIHPSVAWRFEDAAYKYTAELAGSGSATFEAIEFQNVYPLYGAMDIRASSAKRNEAIRVDLAAQLCMARDTLAAIDRVQSMPITDYFDTKLRQAHDLVSTELHSGDEIEIIEVLQRRIHPFFRDMATSLRLEQDAKGHTAIDRYFTCMDAELNILYDQRREYEQAVATINDTLGAYLEKAQVEAQATFPHYFEMFKSDGVEHSIYVGDSMTRDQTFSMVRLENLRLWQLRAMCDMARLAEDLAGKMNVPLRTTPLVLAQSSPLTIKFSAEEKQFVVEGSYNIRYAIMKKRIDKSTIRETNERLTQPGFLSVIYSHDREQDEYLRYFDYLIDKQCIAPGVEQIVLNDLQGVSGLRALRGRIVL